jgi:two-component system nitrogen regulation response regulator GlnG
VGDETTQQLSAADRRGERRAVVALTLLAHPDMGRVGQRALLYDVAREPVRLSRLEPAFAPAGGGGGRPIDDAYTSRSPVTIHRDGEAGLRVEAAAGAGAVVGGHPLDGARAISHAELDGGITIELGPRVAVLLHRHALATVLPPAFDLVGDSDAIVAVRAAIARIAPLALPVLIRGETGTGKELVARAIHAASGRPGPLVAVNVAAIPPSTASSALFGHVRGAFTGAVADLDGHFRDADHGTLFLDEIGEVPLDVQATMLRAIESSEVQPVGAGRAVPVDVRLIAATDRDLEAAVGAGRFREALLHRLAAFQLVVPPLRARRDDIARLLVGFLRAELAATGREGVLADPDRRRPWLPAPVVAELVRSPWPGNVRQLRNVARQLAMAHDHDQVAPDTALRASIGLAGSGRDAPAAAERTANPSADQIVAALERNKYSFAAAAAELGVSRARLYALAERAGGVRTARDVSREEIEAALAAAGGDLDAAAVRLKVSPRALTLRITELGIERR